jgi:hypothetical protein
MAEPVAKPTPDQQMAAKPPPRKLGEGMIADMLARGATEIAVAIGVQGYDHGAYGHVMNRGR